MKKYSGVPSVCTSIVLHILKVPRLSFNLSMFLMVVHCFVGAFHPAYTACNVLHPLESTNYIVCRLPAVPCTLSRTGDQDEGVQ